MESADLTEWQVNGVYSILIIPRHFNITKG
jgi:hypothetical protein